MAAHEGIPWDPGCINRSRIRAIAWGQEMFCRDGRVTLDIHSGLGFGCWSSYMGLAQLINTWTVNINGHEKAHEEASNIKSEPSLKLFFFFVSVASSQTPSPSGLATIHYSWPFGPGQTGRPESRRFWPSPGTARHGPGSARAGLRFEARGPARHGMISFFYLFF